MRIGARGRSKEEIQETLEAYRKDDGDHANGRLFSLVYPTRPDVADVARDAYLRFFSENALNPMTFPSLGKLEGEVVSMALGLLHAPSDAAGSMTSGGSESLLLAVKTARDHAGISEPEMLLPITAHPALLKAAHICGVKPVLIPATSELTADVSAARALVSDRTILIVGSAPQYPHGVVDPIADLARLAEEKKILCHVDACVGGFMLPWVKKLGYPVPAFDFEVPGVTSISADLHKYAYAAKGASVLLHRSRRLRRSQHFVHADWPGGLFGSPSILGTRPGGAIAAAWAVMNYLGEEGYLALAKQAMDATTIIGDGIRSIEGLSILGKPATSILSFVSKDIDLYVLADRMQEKGWRIDRQQSPASLHLTISPAHLAVADAFVADLRAAADSLRGKAPERQGAAAMYGMLGDLASSSSPSDRAFVSEALLDFMDSFAS